MRLVRAGWVAVCFVFVCLAAGVAMLAAPHPLLLHNLGKNFSVKTLRKTYAALKTTGCLRVEQNPLDDAALAKWISSAAVIKNP